MELDIKENASLNDASEIDEIVSKLESAMGDLANVIRGTIPDRVQTVWSLNLKDEWDKYYTADIPEVMEEMKQSATNLRKAVEASKTYSTTE